MANQFLPKSAHHVRICMPFIAALALLLRTVEGQSPISNADLDAQESAQVEQTADAGLVNNSLMMLLIIIASMLYLIFCCLRIQYCH